LNEQDCSKVGEEAVEVVEVDGNKDDLFVLKVPTYYFH
jgi:phosphoribosyl-ATP pyrophosphohydrolase